MSEFLNNNPFIYDMIGDLLYGAMSLILSAYFIMLVCFMVKSFKPAKTKEKKQELSKKNKNRRLNETSKTTDQRKKLSAIGVCYMVGNYNLSPAVYDLLMRPGCGAIAVGIYYLITHRVSVLMPVIFILGDIGFDLFVKAMGRTQEHQIEWDIYKALTNVRLQLTTGAYLEDSLRMVADSAIHPRFAEAMQELIKNMNDKSKTTSESIAILKTRFSSERVMNFCKILETFITYGPVDNVFNDMKEELKSMIDTSSRNTANDIRHRYNFSVGWMSMLLLIIGIMIFDLKLGNNEIVDNGVVQFILGIWEMLGIS